MIIDDIIRIKTFCKQSDIIPDKLKLSLREIQTLETINNNEGINLKDFAVIENLSVSRASRVINKMTETNLLNKKDDTNDRRNSMIYLTDAGSTLIQSIRLKKEQCEDTIKKRLNPDEYSMIEEAIKKLASIL